LVWAAFIGWASYDLSGADRAALFTSSTCMVFGVVMAWLVAVVVAVGVIPLSSSALAAAVASFIIVSVSRYAPFSNVAATFYGFASAFAFLLLSAKAFLDQCDDLVDSGKCFDLRPGFAFDRLVAGRPSSAPRHGGDRPRSAPESALSDEVDAVAKAPLALFA
jgi:Protein of unknown function (DUF1097)